MRISQAIRLGHANVTAHRGRSLAIVLTISVLFGLVMGVNFVLQGLENSALKYANVYTDGKIYVQSRYRGSQGDAVVRQRVEKYHGEILGEVVVTKIWNDYRAVTTVSPEVVEHLLDTPLENVPQDKLPVMMSQHFLTEMAEAEKRGDDYQIATVLTLPEDDYVLVGVLDKFPDGGMRLGDGQTINLLDAVVGYMGVLQLADVLIVDDGSGRAQEYIDAARAEMVKEYQAAQAENGDTEELYIPEMETEVSLVAVFTDAQEAYKYTLLEDEAEFGYHAEQYVTHEIFGNQVQIIKAVVRVQKMLSVLEIAMLVVAVIVMAFTFAHIVAAEAPVIALYRSLGASTMDIVEIYLAYLLELCMYAVVLATLIGAILAGVMTLMEGAVLQKSWENYYALELPGKVILLGVNWKYVQIVGLMWLVAPVAFVLTVDQLAPKRIAQRLKED